MDLPEIADVERLTLGPDDTLVVRLDRSPISAYEADQLRQQVRSITAHERVLIIDRSIDLLVVTPEGLPSPGVIPGSSAGGPD